jgi:hypothetical protein
MIVKVVRTISFVSAVAVFGIISVARPVVAQSATKKTTPAATPKKTAVKPAMALSDSEETAAFRIAEENQYYAALTGLRRTLLARSSWAPLGEECNTGALRVFGKDTTPEAIKDIQLKLDRMEQLVTLYGAGHSVDDNDARTLVHVISEWEAGISRPKWDSNDAVPRKAFAAGMTGEFPDPNGKGCIAFSTPADTLTFWIPAFTDVTIASTPTVRTKTYGGAEGMIHARDEFFRAHGSDSTAVLEVTEVAPIVRWRDWAAVAVRHLRSDRGLTVDQAGKGGASYLMRRVQNEWRLVAVTRTWGG